MGADHENFSLRAKDQPPDGNNRRMDFLERFSARFQVEIVLFHDLA